MLNKACCTTNTALLLLLFYASTGPPRTYICSCSKRRSPFFCILFSRENNFLITNVRDDGERARRAPFFVVRFSFWILDQWPISSSLFISLLFSFPLFLHADVCIYCWRSLSRYAGGTWRKRKRFKIKENAVLDLWTLLTFLIITLSIAFLPFISSTQD